MAERCEAALCAAGVPFRAGSYPAAHGWMKPDFFVYEHEQAKWGWSVMIETFGRGALRPTLIASGVCAQRGDGALPAT